MTDFKVALKGTLSSTSPTDEIIATAQEAWEGVRNDVIATPASIASFWSVTAFPQVAPIGRAIPPGGMTDQVLAKASNGDYDLVWTAAGNGDMLKVMYDPQSIEADAFDRANHTGTQSYLTITGLGSAANSNASDFATAAQGAKADSAIQPNTAQTLTNKRITPRTSSVASAATLTPDADAYDVVAVSAQAANLTIAAPTGTATDGQRLIIRIRDNGTSRTLTWNAAYSAFTGDLVAATVVSATMIYEFIWNASTSKWDLLMGNPVPGKWQ